MFYVTHYEEYPIYEPAEGGYYYSGREWTEATDKESRRQAHRDLDWYWENVCKPANEHLPVQEQWQYFRGRVNGQLPMIRKNSRYIGEGEFYCMEKRLGSHECGRQVYC